ncbi:MAG: mannonate dehydratase [Gemmatimonadetes bacterium]|nr:mannonate dehydratase [Gemmatimonadota bacterium]
MMHISVWDGRLTDKYLTQVTQVGAEFVDFGGDTAFESVKEQGYPDLAEVVEKRKRLQSYGLDVNRVTLPNISDEFMNGQGNEQDVENTAKAMRVFAEAGVPIARQRFGGDTFPVMDRWRGTHRGGYVARSESLARPAVEWPDRESLEKWWGQFRKVYDALVPIADETGIKLALHPSDTPNQDTPFGGIGFHRVIDDYPSRHVGYLYCCGTRAESGGSAIVLDELNNYGRKGKIFMIHFRNVRGSLATANGFEEVLLDDGDMNMFKLLLELRKVGFTGCINADHHPSLEGDDGFAAVSYSIGYIKACLAALSVV